MKYEKDTEARAEALIDILGDPARFAKFADARDRVDSVPLRWPILAPFDTLEYLTEHEYQPPNP